MAQLPALLRSMERQYILVLTLITSRRGKEEQTQLFPHSLLSDNSLVISQQTVIVYDNAHARSALRTELDSHTVPVSIFTNDVNSQNNTEDPQRPSCCLHFIEATLSHFSFCVSLLPHVTCTGHGQ